MCWFVTAVLPESAPLAELDAVARKFGRQFHPLANPSVERQIARGQRYFTTTSGHCDCGTVLGSHSKQASQTVDWIAEERRLLKKGWSKTKVARALEQKRDIAARSDRAAEEASAAELASWVGLITEVLDSGAREVGLLLHFYRGGLDEEIHLKAVEPVAADRMTGETLRKMREDVLYVFRHGA
jgi:hypothetical protein